MPIDPYSALSHWMPLPELVDPRPGPWEIIDSSDLRYLPSSGMTDKLRRILYTPLDESGRPISLHELAHVLWSPERLPRVRFPVSLLLAVEDARINLALAVRGMKLEFDAALRRRALSLAERDLASGQPVSVLLRAIAALGTGLEDDLAVPPEGDDARLARLRELTQETRARLERARRRGRGNVASFRRGHEIARWLHRELTKLGFRALENQCVVVCGFGHAHGGEGSARGLLVGIPHEGGGEGGDAGRPGLMRVATPPLPYACAPAPPGRSRGRRAAAEGTEFRYIERYPTDQHVFRRHTRRGPGGGSVLIDVSGSMRLTPQAVDRILEAAPGATLVAIYSGRGTEGELRVVARDGHRAGVEQLAPFGGGNIVDVPALQWLAAQRGPRVWLSDGRATGVGDRGTTAIRRTCGRICRESDIVRVRRAEEAAAILARGR